MSFRRVQLKELASLAERTGDGAGSYIEVGEFATARIFSEVQAVSGTSPTLDIVLEDSPDRTAAFQVATLATITTIGNFPITLSEGSFGRYLRAKWTIGGTSPVFKFRIWGLFRT